MSLRSRWFLPAITLLGLAFLVACNGSSTHLPVPPPSGGFSNTDLSGTYTFSVSGQDIDANGNASIFAMAGSFTACGCSAGTISAGTVDLSDDVSTGSALAVNTGSTYSVTSDGRGTVSLSIATSSGAYPVTLDFVLTSDSHGAIIRFDGNGTGSGSLDLQPNAVPESAVENVAYVFSLTGSDPSANPLLASGAFTLDTNGNITTTGATAGVADFTYKFPAEPGFYDLPLTGSLLVGSGTAPGTATLETTFGTLHFDVYTVDATHMKLIETDERYILAGDVFSQTSASIPSGNLVFTMAGLDSSSAPFAAGGIVTSDGLANLTGGLEDVNDAGVVDGGVSPVTPTSFTGIFAASSTNSGRFVVTLTGFLGGTVFAAYPSSGGILMQEIDTTASAGITGGVAMAQTSGASLAASQGYGMNLTGTDLTSSYELDVIAQFNTSASSGMSGLIDLNDFGSSSSSPTSTSNLVGTYAAGTSGTGSATFTSGPIGGVFYYAAGTSALLISTDSTEVSVGAFQEQGAPGSSAAEVPQRHLAMVKAVRAAKRARIK